MIKPEEFVASLSDFATTRNSYEATSYSSHVRLQNANIIKQGVMTSCVALAVHESVSLVSVWAVVISAVLGNPTGC